MESKDLRTETLLSTTIMRRFFDSAALCAASLRMTCVLGFCSVERSCIVRAVGAAHAFGGGVNIIHARRRQIPEHPVIADMERFGYVRGWNPPGCCRSHPPLDKGGFGWSR